MGWVEACQRNEQIEYRALGVLSNLPKCEQPCTFSWTGCYQSERFKGGSA